MSALYHVCPNESNLQFDLAFIFVGLILVLMKNLALSGFFKSSSGGLSAALIVAVSTTFAGAFLDDRVAMTAAFCIALAGAIPKFVPNLTLKFKVGALQSAPRASPSPCITAENGPS